MGSLVGGLAKMKELEALEGIKIKTNLEAIGEGLESFADSLDDGEIETLAEYVKQVAGPILSLTGSGGGAGGAGGGGAAGQAQGGDSDALNKMQSGGGRTNGAAINGASREIAAGQRGEGGANVNAPTDNSNNSTNVTNVNKGGGCGGPPPSPRRSRRRGGMYDRS